MTSDDALAALDNLPEADRIRSRRLAGGVATIVADASGLTPRQREALEQTLKDAALSLPGVAEARVALTAAKPNRTLIAIGSGKGGVGKSTRTANLAVALGYRLRGFPGAWCALAALVLPGSVLLLALAVYLGRGIGPEATLALQAMSAAVVGLILVMTARIVRVGLRRRAGLLLGAGTFLLVGPLALSTVAVIALMLVIGLWLNRPRASEALTPRSDTGPRGGE